MNWYFEKDGVSQGPLSELEIEAKVRGQDLQSHSLLWHVELDEWQPVKLLRPQWLQPVVPVPTPQPKPSISTPASQEVAPAARALPKASVATETAKKPGLLSRLFGFGKGK